MLLAGPKFLIVRVHLAHPLSNDRRFRAGSKKASPGVNSKQQASSNKLDK